MPKERDRDQGNALDEMFGGAEEAWSEESGKEGNDDLPAGRQAGKSSSRQSGKTAGSQSGEGEAEKKAPSSQEGSSQERSSRKEGPEKSSEGSGESSQSELSGLLEMLVDKVPRPPSEKPALEERSNAYVSEPVSEATDQVLMALQRLYGKEVSKSLVTDFALRLVLADLVERGGDSQLARWLDQLD